MQKIPTLFVRDQRTHLVEVLVTPGCEWVTDGEGVPTRKYDGTCVMFDGTIWWARRQIKPNRGWPDGFVSVEHDKTTGKTVGWEPAEQSPFISYLAQALGGPAFPTGTYELCGPKINGNPENFASYVLLRHGAAQLPADVPRDYDGLRQYLWVSRGGLMEGIVWHHPDGRMVKIKTRDFKKISMRDFKKES